MLTVFYWLEAKWSPSKAQAFQKYAVFTTPMVLALYVGLEIKPAVIMNNPKLLVWENLVYRICAAGVTFCFTSILPMIINEASHLKPNYTIICVVLLIAMADQL